MSNVNNTLMQAIAAHLVKQGISSEFVCTMSSKNFKNLYEDLGYTTFREPWTEASGYHTIRLYTNAGIIDLIGISSHPDNVILLTDSDNTYEFSDLTIQFNKDVEELIK